MKLYKASDSSIGADFPAFPVNVTTGEVYTLSIRYKASSADADGLYVRVYEYDGSLPEGKVAVSNNASSSASTVQEDTRKNGSWRENAAVTTDWITSTFTYTPTSTANWTSIVVLNWSGMGTKTLFIRDPFTNCRQVLVLKDIKVAKVPQVLVVQQVPLVLKDIKVAKVPQVPVVQQVPLDLKDIKVVRVPQVLQVLAVQQVPLVLKDIKVVRVPQVLEVTGPTGPQGHQGRQGATGSTGGTGPQGHQGRQGAGGATGPTGPQGVQGASSSSSTSVSPPGSPSDGDLWYDSENGNLYVYYNDGSSSQWVATTHTGPEGPTGPTGLTGPQVFRVLLDQALTSHQMLLHQQITLMT